MLLLAFFVHAHRRQAKHTCATIIVLFTSIIIAIPQANFGSA